MAVFFAGGDCAEDLSEHLSAPLSYNRELSMCSPDTLLRGIKELSCESEQLASHDFDNLLGNNIINHYKDAEKAFEQGTSYLFERLLNHTLLEFEGNEHPDGGVLFDDKNNILLWDNKSKKEGVEYKFPDDHLRQFRRYIRNESALGRRVTCFLIITAELDNISQKNAVKLKAQSEVDTDVALITAENLKLVAENWKKYSNRESFNLQVFNTTGILTWETLRDRMDWNN